MLIPPNVHGSAIRPRSSSDIWNLLNKAGINFYLIALSRGTMKFSMFSIGLMKNVSLCLYPDVNGKYSAYG